MKTERNGIWPLKERYGKVGGSEESNATNSKPGKKLLLVAGLLYLGLIVFGMIAQVIRMGLIDTDDAVATVDAIIASGGMLQVSLISDMISEACLVLLGVACFMIFKKVNSQIATLMLLLVFFSGTYALINMYHVLEAIQLIEGIGPTSAIDVDAVLEHLNLFEEGTMVAQVIGWGPWLVPLGYLGYRSGFFPRAIALALMVGGIGLTAEGILHFIAPEMGELMTPFALVSVIAEVTTCGWLLYRGSKGFAGSVDKDRTVDPHEAELTL